MKITATLVGFGAVYAAAQEVTYPQGFPDCGKTCVNNMLSQAADLGCTDAAPSCLCTKQNFIYGVRDCATESCQDQSLAQQVIQYGSQYCASVGIAVSGIPTATGENPTASTTVLATAGPTNSASGTQSGSSSKSLLVVLTTGSYGDVYYTTVYPNGQPSSDAGASGSIPITTATFETTISASGSDVTSTITSTSFSASEASASGTGASGTESGSASSGVIESTTVTSNGSTFATTTSAAEHTSSQTSEGSSESQTGSGSESESASSTSNPAAQRTAAPVGFIAAAGLAALML